MKEKVLIHKETGELHLLTNKWDHDDEIVFNFIMLIGSINGEKVGLIDGDDGAFEDMGEL